MLVTPTPFNTLLWRIVLLDDEHYDEGFHSLLDPLTGPARPIRFERFERGAEFEPRTADFADAKVLVVLFTCNHCPTAQAYEDRILQLHADFADPVYPEPEEGEEELVPS